MELVVVITGIIDINVVFNIVVMLIIIIIFFIIIIFVINFIIIVVVVIIDVVIVVKECGAKVVVEVEVQSASQ